MRENHIRILCSVLKVEMVYEASDGELTPFFEGVAESPLMRSDGAVHPSLQLRLLVRGPPCGGWVSVHGTYVPPAAQTVPAAADVPRLWH